MTFFKKKCCHNLSKYVISRDDSCLLSWNRWILKPNCSLLWLHWILWSPLLLLYATYASFPSTTYNANTTTTTTTWEVYYVQFTYTTIPSYSAKRDSHSPIQKVGAEAPNTTCSTCLLFAQLKVRFYIILVPPPLLLLLYITAEVYLTKPKKDTLYLSSGKYYFFKVLFVLPT